MMETIIDNIFNIPDREKRNYIWLSFIKEVEDQFRQMQLSPSYKQLKFAHSEIRKAIDEINRIKELHQSLEGFDWKEHRAVYKSRIFQEDIDLWLNDLLNHFLPSSDKKVQEFYQLKEFVYSITEIEPIGIEQLYTREGYIFLKYKEDRNTNIYKYKISSYTNSEERHKVYFQPVMKVKETVHTSLHQVKKCLNKKHQPILLNGYLLECSVRVPFETTLIPIAKGKLCRYLRTA